MGLHRTEAIVIRSMDYGEGNKIITLFTKDEGKVGVIARGAKKVKSRLGAVTQLFTHGEFVYYRTGRLGTLNHGEIVYSRHLLREDIRLAAHAAYMAELVDRALQDEEAGSFLFSQLQAACDALETGKDAQIVTHLFEMRILSAAGYTPVLDECAGCGRTEGPFALSVSSGGILCPNCGTRERLMKLSDPTLRLLRLFRSADLRRVGRIELKDETKQEIKQCMRAFTDQYIALPLKSRSFLDQMEKYNL